MGIYIRVPNMMKHVCVAARIGDSKAPGEANTHCIRKTSNAASADSGCNPSDWHEFWPVAPGLTAKGFCSWGGDGGEWRRYNPGATAPFPQTGLRQTSHGATLSQATYLE